MATYTHINPEEMHEFMNNNGFICINEDQASQEFIYNLEWHDGEYLLKVFSSVTDGGGARDVGQDAIRVVLFVRHNGKYYPRWKGSRVHRVGGWRDNLQSRINEGLARGCDGEDWECENCGGHMILRDGSRGLFYGCENFPENRGGCRFTRSYND
jgi:hypothetical protein